MNQQSTRKIGDVILDLRHISLSFGGVKALTDISFDVREHEIRAIIGPNGAGKSSMLNVINGVYRPQEGEIIYRGEHLRDMNTYAAAKSGIARTFQNIALFKGMSVLDNIMTGRNLQIKTNFLLQALYLGPARKEEIAHRVKVEEVIDFLDLTAWRHAPIAGLPYGVRKVVELGRALCAKPELLFLDEPASGLNPEETRELAFWIDDIRSELGITVVMVEHDMSLVSAVADRVICMAQGRVLAEGSPADV
jgi:branched-chain amino acid transport system ATP-binding protein